MVDTYQYLIAVI